MTSKDVKDDIIFRPPLYILSASLFEVDGTPSFSVMKSFSRDSLQSMTVADLTRMFVEELIPDCVKFICGYNHSIIRYGDNVETEVVFDKNGNSAEKAIVHHVSLSLPLEDACFNGAAGFLHPRDPILDYFWAAQKSGNIIPVCIFKNGLKYKKAEHRNTIKIEEVKDEDVVECEDSIGYDYYYCNKRFGYEESSVIVSHEDYDALSEPSLSCERMPNDTQKKRPINDRKESKNTPSSNLPQVNPPAVLTVPRTIETKPIETHPNIVQSPSHDQDKKKEKSVLTPSPSPMKRRRKMPVSYKC